MTSPSDDLLTEFRFLICRLCNQPLHRPRILHCWHYFCLHCIGGHLESNDFVQCPVCDVKTRLPHKNGLSGLTHKAGGLLSRLSETWSKISACDLETEIRHHCHHLARTISDPLQCLVPSTRVCHSCEEFMCEYCSPLHLIEMHSEQYYLCKRHGEPELAFCEDCRVVACFMCTREEHLYHDTWGLVEKAERYKAEVKELIEKCRNRRWRVEDNLEASVRKTKSEIQEEAKKALEVLTMMVKQREGELLGQVDQFAMEMWIKIHQEKQNSEPQTERYDGLVTLGESLVDFGSSQEIVTTHQHLRYRLSGAIAEQSPLQVPEMLRKEISFVPADLRTVEEEELIGNLSFSTDGQQEPIQEDSTTPEKAESREDDVESRDDDLDSRDDPVIPTWASAESAEFSAESPTEEVPPPRKRKMSLMDNIFKIGREFERRRSLDTILDETSDVKDTGSDPTLPSSKKRHYSAEDFRRNAEEDEQAQSGKKAKNRTRKLSLPATSFHRSMESLNTGKNKERAVSAGKPGNGKEKRFSVFSLSWNRQEAPIVEDVLEAQHEEATEEKKIIEPKLSSSSLGSLPEDSGSDNEDEDEEEGGDDGKDEKGTNKKPRFKVKNLMKKAKSTLSLLPVVNTEPDDKEPGAWNDTLRRKKSSGDSSLNGSMTFSDVGDTNEYDGSRKRYSMTSTGSSATITSTGSEGEKTLTGADVSWDRDGASSSSSENRKKRDPKKWMSKRRADIKHFSRRISGDLTNSLRAWNKAQEEENEQRVHPWDETPAKRYDLEKVSEINSEDSDDQHESTNGDSGTQNGVYGRAGNRRVTFDDIGADLREMNIQSESDSDSDVEMKQSGTEASLPNSRRTSDENQTNIRQISDEHAKLTDDDERANGDDLAGPAVNGSAPYIPVTRATKYVPRKWSRFKANFSPLKNERKAFESDKAERQNYYRGRRFSMF